jgi:predicted nucleic acid-binding protein
VHYHGNTCRDLLFRVARAGLVQAKWSEDILDELVRSLARRGIGTPEGRERLRGLVANSVADCMVTGYKPLIESVTLPDPDDRHVVAAAIRSKAQLIVTTNMKDFPRDALEPWDLEARTPDDFLMDLIDIDAWIVYSCVQEIVAARTNPPVTIEVVLGQLERSELFQTAGALRLGPP